MTDDTLRRLAKAIHTLFYKTERGGDRYRALESSIEGDDELAAFQALGMCLINFDPIPDDVLAKHAARLKERIEEYERNRPKGVNPRIAIQAHDSDDGLYATRLLERMYTEWQGTLDYEAGVHRFCFYSPFDPQGRRVSTFAQVAVDGECPDIRARSYILGPYLRVADERTGRETDDPWKVLHGDLTPILPRTGDAF